MQFNLPSPGGLVICRFPYVQKPHKPGPQVHPCLILDIQVRPDCPVPVLILAQMTSQGPGTFYDNWHSCIEVTHEARWDDPLWVREHSYLDMNRIAAVPMDVAFFSDITFSSKGAKLTEKGHAPHSLVQYVLDWRDDATGINDVINVNEHAFNAFVPNQKALPGSAPRPRSKNRAAGQRATLLEAAL